MGEPRALLKLADMKFVGRLEFDFPMAATLAHQLADYACALRFEDLSPAVVHEVKRRVIDSLACALGAWDQETCAIARKIASDFSARQGATTIGPHHKTPPEWSA